VLTAVLVAAAFAAGVTGTWSPCGLSMIETLAPRGYAGRLSTTLAACATFALGALAGGVATFGGLAMLGRALGAGGAAATAVAAAIALAAAAGEARGARIVPQVRRQVPEGWRRVLPVPLAAALYGVLLGLGFTTFILTFAVWALAGISVALGDPHAGLLVGVGFGLGRLMPVVLLAPVAARSAGLAARAAMAERPAILRGMRAVDAAALVVCAVALGAAPARAATRVSVVAQGAADPSVSGTVLAWQAPGGIGVFRAGGETWNAPGAHAATGDGRIAWLAGDAAHVQGAAPAELVVPAVGADALAVSATWVAWRASEGGRDVVRSARLPDGALGPVLTAAPGQQLGRPALDGTRLLLHRTTATGAAILGLDLATGVGTVLRAQRGVQLLNPSAAGGRLLYVQATFRRQRLKLGSLAGGGHDRTLLSTLPTVRRDTGSDPGRGHAPGHTPPRYPRPPAGRNDTLWTTALAPHAAYVTRLRQRTGRPVAATLLRVAF
jgi:hypothetical protein